MNRLIEFFARQRVFPELIAILVIGAGLVALKNIRREAFPNVNFDIITVSTIYPGASPTEVENLITSPLEQDLREVNGIKKMMSISVEGRSEIVLQLDPDQVTSDEAETDVQQVVDRFQDLPKDVEEDPIVLTLESKIMPVIEVTISSDKGELDLKEVSTFLEGQIENLPEVAQVDVLGDKKYEYRIALDIEKLQRFDVSIEEILLTLEKQNVTVPAGDFSKVIDGIEKEVVVRTTGEFKNDQDIENVVIRASDLGNPILIKDVATVTFRLAEPTMLYRAYGKNALRLVVKKKERADTITLVDRMSERLEELKKEPLLDGVEIDYINDSSYYIRNRLNVLSSNLLIGLILVLLVLGLFLPVRVALIVSVGIPFSFLATIWIFNYNDVSLNMITMMGLIIVVGMLVDDAVVVTENAYRHMEKGLKPLEAAIKGTQEIWLAVFSSVLTTMLAFFPMAMMTGVFGKFVKYIPMAVIGALAMSLIEAYFVMPSHIAQWAKSVDKNKMPRFKLAFERQWKKFENKYLSALKVAVSSPWRYLVVAGFGVTFVITIIVSMFTVKFVLFPPEGIEIFFVKVTAPKGSSLEQTEKLMMPLEKVIRNLPKDELKNYVISVGEHRTREDGADTKRGTHYGQAAVYLTPENERDRGANAIIEDVKKQIGKPEHLEVIVSRVNPGPPVGSPISVGVRGENMDEIKAALDDLYKEVVKWKGVKDLNYNYSLGKQERIIKLDPIETSLAGLTVADVGIAVRAMFEGMVPTTVKELKEEIDVRVALKKEQQDVDVLEKARVMNKMGKLIPLDQIAEIKEEVGIESIYHEANQRQFSLLGDVDTDIITASEVTDRIRAWLPNITDKYPNLSFHFGGEEEDTNESLESLKRTFILAVCLIYFVLILTFGNFYQPILILSAIPLGIMSVLWALMLHGQPMSFMAMLGVIALAGVIVNNAIVYIDFVNKERADGKELIPAILEAGSIRLRPIALTTSTTVCGLLPTAYGLGGLDKFVVPVALSLGWGLFFGSAMVAFFIPALVATAETFKTAFNYFLMGIAGLGTLFFFIWFFFL